MEGVQPEAVHLCGLEASAVVGARLGPWILLWEAPALGSVRPVGQAGAGAARAPAEEAATPGEASELRGRTGV